MPEIRITISVPVGAEISIEEIDAAGADEVPFNRAGSTLAGRPVDRSVSDLIDQVAPTRIAEYESLYLTRAVSELDLSPRLPDSPKRRFEYVNLYPPKRYGARRASAFAVKSGRLEIYCRPEHAASFEHAEVVEYNEEPTWARVYLDSRGAVEDALALTALGLRER